jgi:hypothetical protein
MNSLYNYQLSKDINFNKIQWNYFVRNPCIKTIDYIESYFAINGFDHNLLKKLYYQLDIDTNDDLINYILKYPEFYDWTILSECSHDKVVDLLLDPVNFNNIHWGSLCQNKNPRVIPLLLNNIHKINWTLISINMSNVSLELYKIYPEKINWNNLCHSCLKHSDHTIVKFLENNVDKITDWNYLCFSDNIFILDFLCKHIERIGTIGWEILSEKSNYIVLNHLLNNLEKINWFKLSSNNNNNIVELLLNNTSKIEWSQFSSNRNPKAIKYLIKHPEYINWNHFCMNESDEAIEFLNENLDKIDENKYCLLSLNNNPKVLNILKKIAIEKNIELESLINFSMEYIFDKTYNYEFLKNRISVFKEELIAFVWNPNRYHKWPENPFID